MEYNRRPASVRTPRAGASLGGNRCEAAPRGPAGHRDGVHARPAEHRLGVGPRRSPGRGSFDGEQHLQSQELALHSQGAESRGKRVKNSCLGPSPEVSNSADLGWSPGPLHS